MTQPAAPATASITRPAPSVNGSAPPPAAPPGPRPGRLRTRISGMRTGLIAAAAGTARITRLRRIIRRDRRTPPAG